LSCLFMPFPALHYTSILRKGKARCGHLEDCCAGWGWATRADFLVGVARTAFSFCPNPPNCGKMDIRSSSVSGGVSTADQALYKLGRYGKFMTRQPKRDLRRRQRRQRKVRALRERLENTLDTKERRRLIAKIKKISPAAPVSDK
jgi:hypothetical protein